jgi:LysM repeat protein
VTRVCPLLGLTGDRRSVVDGIDTAHRCHADAEPLPIERGWQAKFCLTTSHPQCERYQQAMARRGAAVSGRTPIGDGLVSTRMVLAPEPAWRGMAGRARRAGPRRLVAAGAVAAVVGATALTALVIADASERAAGLPEPSPSESASPTPIPTPRPTATATATPTPVPTAVPAPVETPTPVPAATPRTYVVQQGDTLAAIAQQFGTTTEAIQAANGITNPNAITVGQVLTIP